MKHELKIIFDRRKCANVSIQQEIWKKVLLQVVENEKQMLRTKKIIVESFWQKYLDGFKIFISIARHSNDLIWRLKLINLMKSSKVVFIFSICFHNNETSINYFFSPTHVTDLFLFHLFFSKDFVTRGEENELDNNRFGFSQRPVRIIGFYEIGTVVAGEGFWWKKKVYFHIFLNLFIQSLKK